MSDLEIDIKDIKETIKKMQEQIDRIDKGVNVPYDTREWTNPPLSKCSMEEIQNFWTTWPKEQK